MKIKIFKSANKVSIMDILSTALDYYVLNNTKENVYKGSIVFLINEYGGSKLQKTAFIPKAEAKYVCREFLNNCFKGYEHTGGSNNNGVITARIFSIRQTKENQYVFQITEGPGFINSYGGYSIVSNNNMTTSARKHLTEMEVKIMAGELLDFINQEEMLGRIKNKPLYTIMPDDGNNHVEHSQFKSTNVQRIQSGAQESKVEPIYYAGQKIDLWSLNVEQLSQIILTIVPKKDEEKRLVEAAKLVLSKKQQVG